MAKAVHAELFVRIKCGKQTMFLNTVEAENMSEVIKRSLGRITNTVAAISDGEEVETAPFADEVTMDSGMSLRKLPPKTE